MGNIDCPRCGRLTVENFSEIFLFFSGTGPDKGASTKPVNMELLASHVWRLQGERTLIKMTQI